MTHLSDETIERMAILMASARIYGQPTDGIDRIVKRWDKQDFQWFLELVVRAEDMIVAARAETVKGCKRRYRVFG